MPLSRKRMTALTLPIALSLTLTVPGIVFAQAAAVDPARTAEALARAQALLQQIGQQKAQLEADNAQMQAEVARTKKTLKSTESALADTEAEVAERKRANESLSGRLARTEKRLADTEAELAEMTRRFNNLTAAHEALTEAKHEVEDELAGTQESLRMSELNNVRFYQVTGDLMALLGDKSWSNMMIQKEPLTGIMNVNIQNMLEEYRAKQYEFLNQANVDKVDDEASPEADAP